VQLAQRATIGLASVVGCRMLANAAMSSLLEACAEATEEAILNAPRMAATTTGIEGRTVPALPLERVRELVATQSVSRQP
jgi:D-aminopeptidase